MKARKHGEIDSALARRVETPLGPDDLVLDPAARAGLDAVATWLTHGARVLRDWGLGGKLRPGCTALFAGLPGTGKTLAAALLGKAAARAVLRVDLAAVTSKYIGETEKNLRKLLDHAAASGAILLFDEADALLGKRTGVGDAHDRYANLETAYLLQRIEAHPGLAIFTVNDRAGLDPALLRRFRVVVDFALPDAAARRALWRQLLPPARLDPAADLAALAERHALPGGAIAEAVLAAALDAAQGGREQVTEADLDRAAARESDRRRA